MQKLLVLDNIRSLYNVGSILRTSDGCGITAVYCCGITPYPRQVKDHRLPHISEKATAHIAKTALGAEKNIPCVYFPTTLEAVEHIQRLGIQCIALESAASSIHPKDIVLNNDWALVAGQEVTGLSESILSKCSAIAEIPMVGRKESFNVHTAISMVLYEFCVR